MKILVVNLVGLNIVPPIRSLLDNLINNNHEITLISMDSENALDEYIKKGVKVYKMEELPTNPFKRITAFFKRREYLRKLIPELMKKCDIIWTTTDKSAVEVGKDLLKKYYHVMELLELVKDYPEYPKQKMIMANLPVYARNAKVVVMPEYNRAMISKVWWNLEKNPVVLPNKPYTIPAFDEKLIDSQLLNKVKNEKRKIVLYQGVFCEDRDLDIIAEAVERMPDYVLYIMGRENDFCKGLLQRHKNIEYLGYIAPPNHIFISKYASVGLLPYKPSIVEGYSELNALYCAPNKIFEYACQGLPMVGSDVPGIKAPFMNYCIGECYDDKSVESIIDAITKVCNEREKYSCNCANYFNSVDLDAIVKSILNQ